MRSLLHPEVSLHFRTANVSTGKICSLHQKRGNTIIEAVAIVIVIIILASIILPKTGVISYKAKIAAIDDQLGIVKGALERAISDGVLTEDNANNAVQIIIHSNSPVTHVPYIQDIQNLQIIPDPVAKWPVFMIVYNPDSYPLKLSSSATNSTTSVSETNIVTTVPVSNPVTNTPVPTPAPLPSADLSVTATGPPSITVLDPYSYTISVKNNGPDNANNVTITNTLPAGTTLAALTGPGTAAGGLLTWAIPVLSAGASTNVTVSVKANAIGTLVANITVASSTPDLTRTNNSTTTTTTCSFSPLITATLTAPTTASVLQPINCTLLISNGSSVPTTIQGKAALPPSINLTDLSAGASISGNFLLLAPQAIPGNSAIAFSFNGSATTNETWAQSFDITPSYASTRFPVVTAQASTEISPTVDLSIGIAAPSSTLAGSNFLCAILISNAGPSTAENISVTNTVIGQTAQITSADGTVSGNQVVFSGLSLAANQTITKLVNLAGVSDGSIINMATVQTTTHEPNQLNNQAVSSTTIIPVSDLSLGIVTPGQVNALDDYLITFVITNAGPSTAQFIVLSNAIPNGSSYVSAADGAVLTGNALSFPGLDIPANSTKSFSVMLQASLATGTTNSSTVNSANFDPDLSQNTAKATTIINGIADLAVAVAQPNNARVGDTVVASITVTNLGPSIAYNVSASLQMSPNLGNAADGQSNPLTFSVGTLAPGAFTVLQGSLKATADGQATLTAGVTADTTDLNQANNQATTTLSLVPHASLVTSISSPATVLAGSQYNLTAVVSNQGPSVATANLAISVPDNVGLVSLGSPLSAGSVNYPSRTIAVGGSYAETLTLTAPAIGGITHNASVTGSNLEGQTNASTSLTVTPVSDITTTVTGPSSVWSGDAVNYLVTVVNNGPSPSTVTTVNTLPAAASFVSCTGGGTLSGSSLTLPAQLLNAGESIIYGINLRSSSRGQLTNLVQVSSSAQDPISANNSAVATTMVNAPAALALMLYGPNAPKAGAIGSYTIVIGNAGTEDEYPVIVTNTLPSNATLVSSDGGTLTGNSLVFPAFYLPAGGVMVLNFSVLMQDGTLNDSVTASSVDATASYSLQTGVGASADLGITLSAPAQINAGSTANCLLTVTNKGISSSTFTLTDNVGGASINSAAGATQSGSVLSWTGTLAAGNSVTYSITESSLFNITNSATVTGSAYDPNIANNTASTLTTVTPLADLVTTLACPATAQSGTSYQCSLAVRNSGPSTATGVIAELVVPTGTAIVSSSGAISGNVVTFTVGNLAAGASNNFTASVITTNGTSVLLSADASTSITDPNLSNNTNTAIVSVSQNADISVQLTGPSYIPPSATFSYYINVSNAGPATASAVTLACSIPGNATVLNAPSGSITGSSVNYSCGSLAAGATLNYAITLSGPTSGNVTATATVATSANDPNTANNTATTTAAVTTTGGTGAGVLVRHAPSLSGGTVQGSVQQMLGEGVTFNSGTVLSGDLIVPGVPTMAINGSPSFSGVVVGTGSSSPSGFTIMLNGGSYLRHVVTRADPPTMPTVASVPSPTGSRSVNLNSPSDSYGSASTLLSINANSGVGNVTLPPGSYGTMSFNSGSGLILGIAGSQNPTVYNFQNLTINSGSWITLAGPVVLNIANSVNANCNWGKSGNASWLTVQLPTGGFTLNSGVTIYGSILAPNGTIIINNNSYIVGSSTSDRFILNSGGNVTVGADVGVTVAAPSAVNAGSIFTYVLSITNTGPAAASSLLVTNLVSPNATLIACTGGGVLTSNQVVFPATSLQAGSTLSYVVTVLANGAGNITNVVQVSTLTPDSQLSNNQYTNQTTVISQADLAVSLSGTNSAVAGNVYTYKLQAVNNGPSPSDCTVSSVFPASAQFVSASTGYTLTGNTISYAIGSMASGATTNFSISLRLTTTGSQVLSSTVQSVVTDASLANNTNTMAVSVVGYADLGMGATAASASVGSPFTYTITVSNSGPAAATSVLVSDQLPNSVQFVSAQGGTLSGSVVTYALASLAAGTNAVLTLTCVPNAAGTISNTFTVTAATPDSNLTNNAASCGVTVTTAPQADLGVYVISCPQAVTGTNFTCQILLTNAGPYTATNLTVTNILSSCLKPGNNMVGATLTTNTVIWNLTSLAPSSGMLLSLNLVPVNSGDATITTTVGSQTVDGITTNNSCSSQLTVAQAADMGIVLWSPTYVVAGTNFNYSIEVSNAGPGTASSVMVADILPIGTILTACSTNGTLNSQRLLTWSLGDMPAAAVLDLQLTLIATNAGTSISNIVSVTSTAIDSNPVNNLATGHSIVVKVQDLFPIALALTTLNSAGVGSVVNVSNGTGINNYGWLSWSGNPSTVLLVNEINIPQTPDLAVGDWVSSASQTSDTNALANAVMQVLNTTITVPVWSAMQPSTHGNLYQIVAFAQIQVLAYNPVTSEIQAKFVQLVHY